MAIKFNEQQTRRDLLSVLLDYDLDLSSDELDELMEDLLPVVEDVYYKGYDKGKDAGMSQISSIEEIAEDDEFLMEEIPDDFYFPSEPE